MKASNHPEGSTQLGAAREGIVPVPRGLPVPSRERAASRWQPRPLPRDLPSLPPLAYLLHDKLLLRLHHLLRPLGLLHAAPRPCGLHACPRRVAALNPGLWERRLSLHVLRGGDLPQTGLLAGFSHALQPEGSQMSTERWQGTGHGGWQGIMGQEHDGCGSQGS